MEIYVIGMVFVDHLSDIINLIIEYIYRLISRNIINNHNPETCTEGRVCKLEFPLNHFTGIRRKGKIRNNS